MAQLVDDQKRQLVPRWWPLRIAVWLGLLEPTTPVHGSVAVRPSSGELEQLREDWERHRSPVHAAELVDAAFVSQQPEMAADAAKFLLGTDASVQTRALANALLSHDDEGDLASESQVIDKRTRWRRIAAARRSLRRTVNDPIRWTELAREYSLLGQEGPALDALRRATALAPANRFVLRAATHFLIHTGDADQAVRLLRRARRTREDPWLAAAEIAASQAAGREVRWARHAQRMVESGTFVPRQISELAGALGTLEHEHGNRRKARRMFDRALIEPTENTVAQASWLARHMRGFDAPQDHMDVPRAFEAGAWDAYTREEYVRAVHLSQLWLQDEPLSTRAALFGSWIAVTALGDHHTGAAFVETARAANPHDPRLIAQLAFCRASLGDLEAAEQLLTDTLPGAIKRYSGIRPAAEWMVLEAADRGLIAFRRGQLTEGHRHYSRAIELAVHHRLKELATVATLYYAREQAHVLSDSSGILSDARQMLAALAPVTRPAYECLLRRPIGEEAPYRPGLSTERLPAKNSESR